MITFYCCSCLICRRLKCRGARPARLGGWPLAVWNHGQASIASQLNKPKYSRHDFFQKVEGLNAKSHDDPWSDNALWQRHITYIGLDIDRRTKILTPLPSTKRLALGFCKILMFLCNVIWSYIAKLFNNHIHTYLWNIQSKNKNSYEYFSRRQHRAQYKIILQYLR